ncbi:MAG: Eco29kI family restriction endonuclease [Kiritimatiellia bacterium]|jgi:hypothetical protein
MPILNRPFKREEHVYENEQFSEMLKDAVRFFHGTPVFNIPPPEKFSGAGVYALYCLSRSGMYSKFGNEINRTAYSVPIYVGKAVPRGWRQNRMLDKQESGNVLFSRLSEHASSIQAGKGLSIDDFACRFVIFEGESAGMIGAVEAAIIREHNPLWNSVIDGFGNHDPGSKRVTGRMTQWDALHPGRAWAARMEGEKPDAKDLLRRVKDYMVGLRCR